MELTIRTSRVALAAMICSIPLTVGSGPAFAEGAHGAQVTAEAALAPDRLGEWGAAPAAGEPAQDAGHGEHPPGGEAGDAEAHAALSADAHAALDHPIEVAHGGGDHSDAHGHHANHGAVFLGPVAPLGAFDAAVGLDYERRLGLWDQRFGVVAFTELGYGEHTAFLAGAGVAMHPWRGLKIMAGGGLEAPMGAHAGAAEEADAASHETGAAREAARRAGAEVAAEEEAGAGALARVAVGWEVSVRRFSVSPTALMDLSHGELSAVFGAEIGVGF